MNCDNNHENLKKNIKAALINGTTIKSTTTNNSHNNKRKKSEETEPFYRKENCYEDQNRPFRLVLSHNPDSCDAIKYFDVDMVVSGHTHGIFFFLICFDY
jgi:predicted MPP superfamily phosphohydrolase